jgi:hypothetical protein
VIAIPSAVDDAIEESSKERKEIEAWRLLGEKCFRDATWIPYDRYVNLTFFCGMLFRRHLTVLTKKRSTR